MSSMSDIAYFNAVVVASAVLVVAAAAVVTDVVFFFFSFFFSSFKNVASELLKRLCVIPCAFSISPLINSSVTMSIYFIFLFV